jgi:hypothetical protein
MWGIAGAAIAGVVAAVLFPLIRSLVKGQVTLEQLEADPRFYILVLMVLFGVGCVGWAGFWFWRVSQLIDEARAWKFGLRGEQAVAEKLMASELAAAGYVCFHDLPCRKDGKEWNVDHVVVGPGGVFVLETKARARRKATRDQEESKVVFDGEKLQFPWCVDWDVVGQVRRNAEWVRDVIKEFGPEEISVQPVIVVRGGMWSRRGIMR